MNVEGMGTPDVGPGLANSDGSGEWTAVGEDGAENGDVKALEDIDLADDARVGVDADAGDWTTTDWTDGDDAEEEEEEDKKEELVDGNVAVTEDALDEGNRAMRGTCTPGGLIPVGGSGFPEWAWGIGMLGLVA